MEAFDDDDDFGEIYADVEPPLTAIPADLYIDKKQQQQTPDPNSNGDRNGYCSGDEKLVVGFSDGKATKNDDDVCCVGSDSDDDDDLNIVLNDDDCNGLLPVRVAASDDVDGGGGDQLDDSCESATKIGAKGGYGSRFFHRKYMRTRGSTFVNNMKANVNSIGMASSLNKGRRNVDSSFSHVTRMCAAANPMRVQCGYGSFLPWYWSVLDVNMETFPEKPWRIPGVEITDYFNFGFTENTWKLYCASLEQLWQTSGETSIPDDESLKFNQEAMTEHIDQVVAGSVLSPSSEFEPPKGRAIQVEDSMIERQPSIDVRRPRSRDSDVIIQIKVHESSDDCSGSGNSIVMDASLEAQPIVGYDGCILNSSGECDDVLSEDHLEDVKNSVDSSAQERTGLIPGVDEDEHQDKVDQHSEGAAKVPRGEIKAEDGIAIDTCSADPCWIESELSLGDQELSLTSYTDSDYEATEDSLHVDNEKSHSPLRRKSVNSVTSLKESLPLNRKASNCYGFNRKLVNVSYYARNRGSLRKNWRHQNGRHEHGSNLNEHFENDTDASSIPMSGGRDLSLLGHQLIDYDICKERQWQGYASRKRRDIPYNRETKQSFYGSEKVNDNQFQTLQTKYSFREDREVFRENTNRYGRKHGRERDYFFEPRSPVADNEEREGDWHHADWGYYDDDLSPRTCWESRQFLPKHSSFPDEERGAYRRRINDKYHFRDRYCNDDFDECEFEFLSKSYRMSTSAEREMESLNNKDDEEQFLYADRDWERSARRDSHCDRPPLVLDDLWSGKREDNCEKFTHPTFRHCRQPYKNSVRNYAYGTRGNDNFEVCGRPKRARDNRGSDWFYGYTDTAEDFMIDPAEEYQFYRSPSKVLNWTEDEIICRHVETRTTSLHARVRIDDIKLQQHQLNMPRRSSENCLKGSSKIMGRGKRWQAVLRCRKSFDLVNGDGKSHTSSRVLCSGKLEYVDRGVAKKRRALVGSDESHEKAIKSGTSKCDSNHENKELLQNPPDKGHKENSDIEEGQIVTEEPYTEASVSRRDVSEGAAVTESVKKSLSQNQSNSDQLIGGYDSQRILDSLAKMEKRRERFKQPISTKKEAEESLKPNNDSLVDTGDMKQHRPPRKRRWVGS